jgi:hypothetical protein
VPPGFPGFAFIGSLAVIVTIIKSDFRPMTLRHYLSVILRFGWLVDPDQQRTLILDAELCAAGFSRFCFYR